MVEIDPHAWAEAVRTQHDGKPLWIALADGTMGADQARTFLSAYLAECERRASMWDKALRVAAALIAPKPLKAEADGFDRIAYTTSDLNRKAIEKLIGHPEFANLSAAAPLPEPTP
jgi:hypothetical protein